MCLKIDGEDGMPSRVQESHAQDHPQPTIGGSMQQQNCSTTIDAGNEPTSQRT
jgi:hypothetical protein